MNALYLSTSIEALGDELVTTVHDVEGDFFTPIHIVTPNRYLSRWIQMRVSSRLGVAMNLRFDHSLERLLWKLLTELDPDSSPVEQLSDVDDRLLIASALLDEPPADDLCDLAGYCRRPGRERDRSFWRRLWNLAGRMADLLRDYEYHRHGKLAAWKHGEFSFGEAHSLERAQRALYVRLCDGDGLRSKVGRIRGRRCFSLPAYAEHISKLKTRRKTATTGPILLFGIGAVSMWHAETLRWLSAEFDINVYHANPLVIESEAELVACTSGLNEWLGVQSEKLIGRPDCLAHFWGQAGIERLKVLSKFPTAGATIVPAAESETVSVLHALQRSLLDQPLDAKVPQDCSLQIVASPGVVREIETVYNSILHNLRSDPTLRLTDIAVLCPDMETYRPVIQSVFDRPPRHVPYNLADYSAAELSLYGRGIVGLLDLAQESFTRSRVMAVLLNPCCLAALGISREEATCWLDWAEKLGIFHGWDRKDRKERGYVASDLHTWQLGLRRLRLGRIMDGPDDEDESAPCFGDVIPFSDFATTDAARVDAFSHAVQQLLPWLSRLRNWIAGGREWANEVRSLADRFLQPPEDRPEEKQVRDALFQVLGRLSLLDDVGAAPAELSLALVREFIQENLVRLTAATGEYLVGGVTVAAPQPLLPTPFRIIYLVGMGEGPFPGSDQYSPLDLRGRQKGREVGDIHLGEANRFLFLQTILAARDKLYITYNCRNLLMDQELSPCGPVTKLRRFLGDHLLEEEFREAKAPLSACDPRLLGTGDAWSDTSCCHGENERLLALREAERGTVRLTAKMKDEIQRRIDTALATFDSPPREPEDETRVVHIAELARFLRDPAEAFLRRHLNLRDEDVTETRDDEPFYMAFPHDHNFRAAALRRLALHHVRHGCIPTLEEWQSQVEELYRRRQREGQAPDGCFGEAERYRIWHELEGRYDELGALFEKLPKDGGHLYVRIGDSLNPPKKCRACPDLVLAGTRVRGRLPLVWIGTDSIETVVVRTGKAKGKAPLAKQMIEPALFYLAMQAHSGDCDDLLRGRAFRIHLIQSDGIVGIEYAADVISKDDAKDYVADLAGQFLQLGGVDLLPFDLLASDDGLLAPLYRKACNADEYAAALREAFDADREGMNPVYRIPNVVRLANPQVPADAFDKLARRFGLLCKPLIKDEPEPATRGKRGRRG